jgi:hypothetical protein
VLAIGAHYERTSNALRSVEDIERSVADRAQSTAVQRVVGVALEADG